MAAWLLGTNFCALGLMARPCFAVAPTVSDCPHCPAKPTSVPVAAPCCQEVRAELPPAVITALPALAPVAVPRAWADGFSPGLTKALEAGSPCRAIPDTGPPESGRVALRVLLGRCAPVHAPPALG